MLLFSGILVPSPLLRATLHRWYRNQTCARIWAWHMVVQRTRVNYHLLALKVKRKAIQASGGWTIQILSIRIVM
jgi:hypothetical protein